MNGVSTELGYLPEFPANIKPREGPTVAGLKDGYRVRVLISGTVPRYPDSRDLGMPEYRLSSADASVGWLTWSPMHLLHPEKPAYLGR